MKIECRLNGPFDEIGCMTKIYKSQEFHDFGHEQARDGTEWADILQEWSLWVPEAF